MFDVSMKFSRPALCYLVSAASPSSKKKYSTYVVTMLRSSGSEDASMRQRSSETELRRASGGKSFERFQQTVQGWTAAEINALNDGKNPVHMAAWKGSLDNLKYLLETLECNIDVISKGEFSYGKTPIFFALTQSREDVVEYLLEQGACVKIVNNKGQTPLSIAASHLSEGAIANVQELELKQRHIPWTNYRATHSDGLEYGDIDPRFLERTLRETDNVTALAINPTSKEIRRGNFLRNNPHVAREGKKSNTGKTRRRKSLSHARPLPPCELDKLRSAWDRFEQGLSNGIAETDDLITIVRFSIKQRTSWIPMAASRLRNSTGIAPFLESVLSKEADTTLVPLIQRLLTHIQDPRSTTKTPAAAKSMAAEHFTQPAAGAKLRNYLMDPKWRNACQHVRHLSLSFLENGMHYLSLPKAPVFVDTLDQLINLEDALVMESVVGIDSEWHEDDSASTLQVSFRDTSWVIDLLNPDAQYQARCRTFIRSLFACEKDTILLGFAVGNDVPRLEKYVGECLSTEKLMDLQLVMLSDWSQMPGLASCVAEFSSLPLSKEQQCSDWSQRPLTPEQVEYAGLDAAVLPFLLAERYNQMMGTRDKNRNTASNS